MNTDEMMPIFVVVPRNDAQQMVDKHTFTRDGFKCVDMASCRELLGDRLSMLLGDPIRNKGGSVGCVYPWNVVDYLCNQQPRRNQWPTKQSQKN